jgi:hypothetical protein
VYETPGIHEEIEDTKRKMFLDFRTHVSLPQKPRPQRGDQKNDVHHATMTDETTSLDSRRDLSVKV